jgi:hypothetical protein
MAAALAAAPAAGAHPRIALDRTAATVRLGHSFAFTSRVSAGAAPTGRLVLHLNVVSLDPSTYVDPEDWSSHRTRYLRSLAAGAGTSVRWSVKAVNSGRFVVYVSAIRAGGGPPISVGPPLRVRVAERRTLNAGGVLPLVLGVPAGVLVAGVALRRRSTRAA